MKVLCCHPSGLMYTEIYPAPRAAGRRAGGGGGAARRPRGAHPRPAGVHARRLLRARSTEWRPDAVAFGVNYLANIPEVVDLAKADRRRLPHVLLFVGGHSASFTAREILEHAAGAIDCVVKGEGEEITPRLLEAARDDREAPAHAARRGHRATARGRRPSWSRTSTTLMPARDLLPRRQQVLHRRARSGGVDRVHPRLPVGLLVLQRLDVLRPQLPRGAIRELIGEELARIREPGRVHRRRRRVHPGRARLRDRRRDRAARHPQAVLPRDARRRAAAQQGGVPRTGSGSGSSTCSSASRRSTRRGSSCYRKRDQAVDELRGARVRALARDHGRGQHHRRPRLGRGALRGRSASGRCRSRRS